MRVGWWELGWKGRGRREERGYSVAWYRRYIEGKWGDIEIYTCHDGFGGKEVCRTQRRDEAEVEVQ